jgi:hypothetical protein
MSNINVKTLWAGACLPAKVFPVVMAGVVLFNLWRGVWTEAVKNVIVTAIGTSVLWLLCSAGMELLAYAVLAVPVIFVLFLLAVIVFDGSLLSVTHSNGGGGYRRPSSGCDDCDTCDGCQDYN